MQSRLDTLADPSLSLIDFSAQEPDIAKERGFADPSLSLNDYSAPSDASERSGVGDPAPSYLDYYDGTDRKRYEDIWSTLGEKVVENFWPAFKRAGAGALMAFSARTPMHRKVRGNDTGSDYWREINKRAAAVARTPCRTCSIMRQTSIPESLKGYAYDLAMSIGQMMPAVAATVATAPIADRLLR